MLIKMAIIVAIVLIGGTLMVNPDVDAAPGNQGTPFESVWNAIDNLGQTLGMITCANGQVVKWDDASEEWKCADDNGADDNGAAQLNVETVEGPIVMAMFPFLWEAKAVCPPGTTLTGGGHRSFGYSNAVEGVLVESRPISDQEWRVQFQYQSPAGSGNYFFKATAMCASITP